MNRYSWWKNLLILLPILIGTLYALPNLYGEDLALQISPRKGSLSAGLAEQVTGHLRDSLHNYSSLEQQEDYLLLRFEQADEQLAAKSLLNEKLGENYVIALNLAPATPAWLRALAAAPMYLGLDLRGGVHFLMELDMEAALRRLQEDRAKELRGYLRNEKLRYRSIQNQGPQTRLHFSSAALRDQAATLLRTEYTPDILFEEADEGDDFVLYARAEAQALERERSEAVAQNIIVLRNRINELGIAEPVVQQQGRERIIVQLPGVQDTARAKEILGGTASLEFRLVDEGLESSSGRQSRNYRRSDGSEIQLQREVIVTGDQIKDASSGFDSQSGTPAVFIRLDGRGAKQMQKVTAANLNKSMAVVYIENRQQKGADGKLRSRRSEEVINVATIRDVLSYRFQITGMQQQEAQNLSLLLRAGALKVPIFIVEERTVGPSLGQDNIRQGMYSVLLGFVLVLLFMAFYYKVFGLVANLALTANLLLIVALLSLLQATLTLPGIAGIVLTVGMAVDANVLIFERIREELRNRNSVQASINAGYEKAFSTIADANITTLIAAIALFSFGTGAIKGFAITISIGILTSMFTAILGTRAVINLLYGRRRNCKRLAI